MNFASARNGSRPDTARRWVILASVAVIHAGVFYGLVVGLAGVVKMVDPPRTLTAHDDPITVPVARPIEHPKPQPDTPRRVIQAHIDTTVVPRDVPPLALPSPDIGPISDGILERGVEGVKVPPPPTPSSGFTPRRAVPRGTPGAWISPDDYPAQDLREGNVGTTGFRLVIGRDGQPQSCAIIRSSGHSRLDEKTCELVSRRARFNPATDDTGAAVAGSYQGKVYWTIPDR